MKRKTRLVAIGSAVIGGDADVLIQSMCSTKTTDIAATVRQIEQLVGAGAGLVRLAVDSREEALALRQIRAETLVPLSVDIQENFRLAEDVAPFVDKIRYNPGHLHHLERELSWEKKVDYFVEVARTNQLALRVGVNCGSIPRGETGENDPMLQAAIAHCDYLDSCGFTRYCVSIKDSDPQKVVRANRLFAKLRPDVPLHLGVTEAGLLPMGMTKSRLALEPLLVAGIGETIRVSLTTPVEKKSREIDCAKEILENVRLGKIIDPKTVTLPLLNIISCPSCSRVESERFVELAEKIVAVTAFARDIPLNLAVMGCRVNGPGEADSADIGLWCGKDHVNLHLNGNPIGRWKYEEIPAKVVELVEKIVHNGND